MASKKVRFAVYTAVSLVLAGVILFFIFRDRSYPYDESLMEEQQLAQLLTDPDAVLDIRSRLEKGQARQVYALYLEPLCYERAFLEHWEGGFSRTVQSVCSFLEQEEAVRRVSWSASASREEETEDGLELTVDVDAVYETAGGGRAHLSLTLYVLLGEGQTGSHILEVSPIQQAVSPEG